jgi:transcriptional regulator with XRE-family HTH domain
MTERAKLRKLAGMTQRQLGRKVGKSGATICLWERGDMELSPADVGRIARVIVEEATKNPPLSSAAQILGVLDGSNAQTEAVHAFAGGAR